MSTDEITYPDVTVHLSTHQDGNAFFVMGAVSRQIRRTVGDEAADRFTHDAMDCVSYLDLLAFIQRTVNVT